MTCRLRECAHHKDDIPCPVHPLMVNTSLLMTPAQEQHLAGIINQFNNMASSKYRRGQAEHGGNLFDLPAIDLVNEALAEAIDQVTYLSTLRDKIIELYDQMRSLAEVINQPPNGK